jgi:hypothetical protein
MNMLAILLICMVAMLPSLSRAGAIHLLHIALAHPLATVLVAFLWRLLGIYERRLDAQLARYEALRAFYVGYERCAGNGRRLRREPPPWDPSRVPLPIAPPGPKGTTTTAPGMRALRFGGCGARLRLRGRALRPRAGRRSSEKTILPDGAPRSQHRRQGEVHTLPTGAHTTLHSGCGCSKSIPERYSRSGCGGVKYIPHRESHAHPRGPRDKSTVFGCESAHPGGSWGDSVGLHLDRPTRPQGAAR